MENSRKLNLRIVWHTLILHWINVEVSGAAKSHLSNLTPFFITQSRPLCFRPASNLLYYPLRIRSVAQHYFFE
jgi:hypothetical protein